MSKFNLQEDEKKYILSMHKVLVKEQAAPQPEKSISDQLQGFITNGCAKNGKVVKMKSTNPQKQFAIKQESTKTPGKFRYLFIDYTIGMTDETGKFKTLPTKWECNAAAIAANTANQAAVNSASQASEDQKSAFIKKANKVGYLETLTPEQKASGLYKKYKVPGSEEFFPPNGIEMFYNPASVTDTTSTTQIQTDTESNIPKDIKDCKTNIEMYYTNFTRKRPMSQVNFDALKNKVQACKNEFYGNWGILRGGRKMDNILDIMSGKEVGGPSRRGEDAKWRLN